MKNKYTEILENNKRTAGFSLIELLIVVVIIGIIAAFTIPSLIGSKRGVNQKLAISQLTTIKQAQRNYRDDLNIGRYATLGELRNTTPGGNPLVDPLLINTDGSSRDYKEWRIEQIEDPTTTTFGLKMVPSESNPADYSFFMYEDGTVRRTGTDGPYSRNGGEIVE